MVPELRMGTRYLEHGNAHSVIAKTKVIKTTQISKHNQVKEAMNLHLIDSNNRSSTFQVIQNGDVLANEYNLTVQDGFPKST